MQDTLRARLQELRKHQQQGEHMVRESSDQLKRIEGAIKEVTAFLNHLTEVEKIQEAERLKAEAEKQKAKLAKKKTKVKILETTENTETSDETETDTDTEEKEAA